MSELQADYGDPEVIRILGWEEHEHEYYGVQFSWGGYVECACGHQPTYKEASKLEGIS